MTRPLALLPAFAVLVLGLGGCGLRPVYGGGSLGAVARAIGTVDVAPIEGKAGWLTRNALNDRLAAMNNAGGGPGYRLVVKLDDQITGFGVRLDDTITRERRTLRARYQLLDANGKTLIDKTAAADAGLDVTSSEYATISAEDSALERLSQSIVDDIIAEIAQRAALRAQ